MRKKILILASLVVLIIAGVVTWRIQETRAKSERRESRIVKSVSAEEIVASLKIGALLSPEKTQAIVKTPESRKVFINSLREYFALAARGRREGLADSSDYDVVLNLKENAYLADAYAYRLSEGNPDFKRLTKEDLLAFLADPVHEKEYQGAMDALYAIQAVNALSMESPQGVSPKPYGENLEKVRQQWAWTRIYSDRARADKDFMKELGNQSRLSIIDASIVSAGFLAKYWKKNVKANADDISKFLAEHPEYDVRKKKELAEAILARVKSGESIVKLAETYSEDRSTRNLGGLYTDQIKNGGVWTEVENAALKLENGQVADRVIETKDGFHIVQLLSKSVSKESDGAEKVLFNFRHILLQRKFEKPGVENSGTSVPAPFMLPEEIAKDAVEKLKRQRFVDEVVQQENISFPDDFLFE